MDYMYDLKDKLCEELEEIARKPEMSAGDLETVHKLTDTIKNIEKIGALEDGGYSRDGDWMARGTYERGSSYRGQKRDSMGRYVRNGRMYSRAEAKDEMMNHLDMMMSAATTDREREIIKRCMSQLEQA